MALCRMLPQKAAADLEAAFKLDPSDARRKEFKVAQRLLARSKVSICCHPRTAVSLHAPSFKLSVRTASTPGVQARAGWVDVQQQLART